MHPYTILLGMSVVVAYVIITDERAAAIFVYGSKLANTETVSYTHLTLPTNREV